MRQFRNSAFSLHIPLCHIQNPDLFGTPDIFESLSNMPDDQSYSEPRHSQNSLFKYFEECLDIFRDIDAFSATLISWQLRERAKTYPAFFENQKKCPNFGKRGPECVHLWTEISNQNIVVRVPRRKNSKTSPCRTLFYCVFDKMFINVV